MTQRIIRIILALTLTPIQEGHSVLHVQAGQEVSDAQKDAQKREFLELLHTLPSKGEFYTPELRRTGHQGRVSALVFSADGKWLVSGSWDHTVKLWDVNSGEQIRSFPAEGSDNNAKGEGK